MFAPAFPRVMSWDSRRSDLQAPFRQLQPEQPLVRPQASRSAGSQLNLRGATSGTLSMNAFGSGGPPPPLDTVTAFTSFFRCNLSHGIVRMLCVSIQLLFVMMFIAHLFSSLFAVTIVFVVAIFHRILLHGRYTIYTPRR